jgi:Predicted GTPase
MYLNTYRRLISDVVIVEPELRLVATAPLEGRVAVFTAGATDVSHLDADVVRVSPQLADRDALRADLVDADTYLVELKGAAVDVVIAHATERGIRVVVAGNELVDESPLVELL